MLLHNAHRRSPPDFRVRLVLKPRRRVAGRSAILGALLVWNLLVLVACAPPLVTRPVTMTMGEGLPDRVVTTAVKGASSASFSRTIASGSRLRFVGSIPEGQVWKPLGWVLLAEGRHMHEAYVVDRNGQ